MGKYRVTRAYTHNFKYYEAGAEVEIDDNVAKLFHWKPVKTKAASAPAKKGARKPAAKK